MVDIDDAEGVILAPHQYLDHARSPKELDEAIMNLLKERGRMTTSQLWKELDCHLWELSASLRRLKQTELVEERDF